MHFFMIVYIAYSRLTQLKVRSRILPLFQAALLLLCITYIVTFYCYVFFKNIASPLKVRFQWKLEQNYLFCRSRHCRPLRQCPLNAICFYRGFLFSWLLFYASLKACIIMAKLFKFLWWDFFLISSLFSIIIDYLLWGRVSSRIKWSRRLESEYGQGHLTHFSKLSTLWM